MLQNLIETITLPSGDNRAWLARVAQAARVIRDMRDSELDELAEQLLQLQAQLAAPGDVGPNLLTAEKFQDALQPVLAELNHREAVAQQSSQQDDQPEASQWSSNRIGAVAQLYHRLPPDQELRNHILHLLALTRQDEAMEVWSNLLSDDPPEHRPGIGLAFAPLMQTGYAPSGDVLTKLLHHATAHPQIAPAVFDLFNFYFRGGHMEHHPAASRCEELASLLGQLAKQMEKIERGEFPEGITPTKVNRLVSDSVAMIISLCDLFALLDYKPAIADLHQSLNLKHRRIQTEAASALARLGDDDGRQALIRLAEEPVARMRVLAYAEELGLSKEISLELQGELATAESHLAIWLSEPKQMGLAPSKLELVDQREYYWPSYEHPLQCYLFRFTYGSGDRTFTNIGICGPLTHAFAADVQPLSIDDIYAAFAGWQTVHNDIFQMTVAQAQKSFSNDFRRLESSLKSSEADDAEIESVGSFFGDLVLIASATQEDEPGTLIVESETTHWIPAGNPKAPIDWQLAYSIWQGRQLLASFNRSESA
jgi:hypothetical protein